jgi:hypothetical protein
MYAIQQSTKTFRDALITHFTVFPPLMIPPQYFAVQNEFLEKGRIIDVLSKYSKKCPSVIDVKSILYLIEHEISVKLSEGFHSLVLYIGADPTLISEYSTKYIKALNVLRLKFLKRIGILIGTGSLISSSTSSPHPQTSTKAANPTIKLRELMDEYLEANERGGAETSTRLHYWLEFLQVCFNGIMYRETSSIYGKSIYGQVLKNSRRWI